MFDFDPRDYDSREDERHGNTPNRGKVLTPMTAIAMTTGGNPTSGRAIEMTRMHGRSAAVLETPGQPRTTTDAIAAMMCVGRARPH